MKPEESRIYAVTKVKQTRNLSRASIVDCAMRHLQEDGLAKLSMRKIAATLNVQVSALYNHFSNKEALIIAMQAHYFAGGNLQQGVNYTVNQWQDFIRSMAYSARNQFLEKPYILELFATTSSDSEESSLNFEKYLSKMLEFGFSINIAGQISQTIYTYICGFTSFEVGVKKSQSKKQTTKLGPEVDAAQLPLCHKFLNQFGWNFERDFEFGIKSLLLGFEQYIPEGSNI